MKRLVLLFMILPCLAVAQYNRSQMQNIITTNIYENPSHKITGTIMQNTMVNGNNSYMNLISDSLYQGFRKFNSTFPFQYGVLTLYNDSIWECTNLLGHAGAWVYNDFTYIAGSNGLNIGGHLSGSLQMLYDSAKGKVGLATGITYISGTSRRMEFSGTLITGFSGNNSSLKFGTSTDDSTMSVQSSPTIATPLLVLDRHYNKQTSKLSADASDYVLIGGTAQGNSITANTANLTATATTGMLLTSPLVQVGDITQNAIGYFNNAGFVKIGDALVNHNGTYLQVNDNSSRFIFNITPYSWTILETGYTRSILSYLPRMYNNDTLMTFNDVWRDTLRGNLGGARLGTQFWVNSQGFLTGNQTITLNGDVTGSGTTAITTTLANTAVTPGSYTNTNLTVDAKGRITAASNGSGGSITGSGTSGQNTYWNGSTSITGSSKSTYSDGNYFQLQFTSQAVLRGLQLYQNSTYRATKFETFKSKGTFASPSAVGSTDSLLSFVGNGYDGFNYNIGGSLNLYVDGTVGNGFVPGRWEFKTANGSGVLTQALILDHSQNVTIPNYTVNNGLLYTNGSGLISQSTALPNGTTATSQTAGDNTTKVATDAFVQTALAGVNPATAVQAATIANVSGYTYANGVSGIGATLTQNSAAVVVIDGYTLLLNDRVLFKNQTTGYQNGVYFISTLGTGVIPAVFTRSLDYDQPSDINNTGAIPVINGTVNASTSWVQTANITTVGTDALVFAQFSYAPSSVVQSVVLNTPNVIFSTPVNFTTSASTATGTLSLNSQSSYTIFGNNTGSSATPTFFAPTLASALFANQGTTTQVLHGNVSGNPSWGQVGLTTDVTGTLPYANGGTNGTYITTDSIGSDSNSFYINGHSKIVENDSVYYTSSSGNNGGWGVKINVVFANISDGEEVRTLYVKKTTNQSLLTFPSNSGATMYTIANGSGGIVSGQTFKATYTSGANVYMITTRRLGSRYLIGIVNYQ